MVHTQEELKLILENLIASWENEVVEFKRAGDDYSTDKIGKYLSALANEANLRGIERAWLVFGVDDKSRQVVGSDYRPETERLQSIKMQMAENTEPSVTFRNVHEAVFVEGRVVMFEIPAAPRGIPIAWKGHCYARAGESLVALGLDKQDEIRNQTAATDWSAQPVPSATVDHLDPQAVATARRSFTQKYANRFDKETVDGWSTSTFLDRARLTQGGAITRTALLLLGKAEAAHLLSPHPVQLTWKLQGAERAYEHFGPPFLLSSSALYQRIRNVQVRVLPDDELLPVEVSKYDQRVVLEALHNCIVHQDYARNGRVIVTEMLDKLVFENEGDFFEGKPEDYIAGEKTPSRYRNPFLAQAMAELNMIDTMGYGIHDMHMGQVKRFFPLPDYDLGKPNSVRVILYGKVVDPAYTRLLIRNTDLPLADVLALDRVQKELPVEDATVRRLRRAGMIEGRRPNLHIAAKLAEATGTRAAYIKTRRQDDAYYAKLVTDFLRQYGTATRKDMDDLLLNKISDGLTHQQKRNKVHNLLGKWKTQGLIENQGGRGNGALYALISDDE
ncbi:MAG: transcriptional regulator [Verrucomicrobia bacterium]|jgi:ATP-dependent DNA helicase RecG|nr:transcriptional regulator [Verrucomicrobiota bacterium]MBT7067147.1 transcriptional regulator [Verrucomicrobiota bacterium]MBT7700190.1 transcriptional regulator [Verrucomicrobiota bacterium]